MSSPFRPARLVALPPLLLGTVLGAQTRPAPRDTAARRDSARTLGAVRITAERAAPVSRMQALTLSAIATVTRAAVDRTVNLVDPEDAVKYQPSVFLRKRNYGDRRLSWARACGG